METDVTDALLIAAADGDMARLASLLESGADPNSVDRRFGNSALYNAVFNDHLGAIGLLLEKGANPNLRLNYRSPIDGRQERGIVALMYARSGPVALALIGAGADPNAADERGITPLMRATLRASPAVVGELVAAGADPFHESLNKQNSLGIARSQIAKYESWGAELTSEPANDVVARLINICATLEHAMSK